MNPRLAITAALLLAAPVHAATHADLIGTLQFEQQLAVADKLIAQERRTTGNK